MKIVVGPPGTGKTTKLLSLVEQYLASGVPPDKIGYFAFTRRAANEAVERACEKFKLVKRDLPYFRTLHSLAFMQIGISHSQILTQSKYKEISDWLKIGNFYGQMDQADSPFKDYGFGDIFLVIINLSRILQQPLRSVYNSSTVPMRTDWSRVDYVNRGLQKWKQVYDLYDYTDMLESFCKRELSPRLEAVFIDEAQDLSPLQWQMVHQLQNNTKEIYVAGDDDQAIFRYAGADVDYFINLDGEVTVLNQSYRIPSLHHKLSQSVISKVVGRRQKAFLPRAEQGTVNWYRHSEMVDISDGDWLLLSRTTRGAKQLEEEVRRRGHLYIYNGSNSIDNKVLEAVRLWEKLRSGEKLRMEQVKVVYKQMLLGKQVEYGHKTLPKAKEGEFYSLQDLKDFHGLLHNLPWDEGLGKIAESDRRYIKACLRKGESLTATPRIRISTIHSAKGAQATNVLMMTDTMRRSYSMWRRFDNAHYDEARVFYVGLTRAIKNLHLIQPMYSQGYSIPN